MVRFRSLTTEERRVAYAVVDWLRLAREEGYPERAGLRDWPSRADVDHSWLLNRLLQGVEPFPPGYRAQEHGDEDEHRNPREH